MYGELFAAALPAVIQGVSQAYNTKVNQDNLKAQREQSVQDSALDFERKKELLAFQAGLGGGGGGGVFTGFTKPQKVQALQGQTQQELDAINAIIAAYQRAVLA